jgi:hypothetical protein
MLDVCVCVQRAVSLEEYRRNLEASVRVCREQLGVRTVVWVQTTPVDDHRHNITCEFSKYYQLCKVAVVSAAPLLLVTWVVGCAGISRAGDGTIGMCASTTPLRRS